MRSATLPARERTYDRVEPEESQESQALRRVAVPSSRATTVRRCIATTLLIAIAYHYSLLSLIRQVGSPVAQSFSILVPIISAVLAFFLRQPSSLEPAIHDRDVDYIVGLPFLVGAVAINLVLAAQSSIGFWDRRIDLLSLPFFVTGCIALVFGVRTVWRLKPAILFLFLVWPWPYTMLLIRFLTGFTNLTVDALHRTIHLAPVARAIPGSDWSVVLVEGRHPFPVSVASACSGLNGLASLALVAIAAVVLVRGKLPRRISWVLFGIVVAWALNVGRILGVLWLGQRFGGRFVADGLSWPLGLLTLTIGVVSMALLAGRFGLTLPSLGLVASVPTQSPAALPEAHVEPAHRLAIPKARLAVAILVLASMALAVSNSDLQSLDPVAGHFGAPLAAAMTDNHGEPATWQVHHVTRYDWSKQFFGNDSTWNRYQYQPPGVTPTPGYGAAVIADVINASNLGVFGNYGVADSYQWHGYHLEATGKIGLTDGISGRVLAYYDRQLQSDWTILYWHWAVHSRNGGIRYERVTLLAQTGAKATSTPDLVPEMSRRPGITVPHTFKGKSDAQLAVRLHDVRLFLQSFATTLIMAQAHQTSFDVPGSVAQNTTKAELVQSANSGG